MAVKKTKKTAKKTVKKSVTKAAPKTSSRKRAAKKASKKRTAAAKKKSVPEKKQPAVQQAVVEKSYTIEPGPPTRELPPVEEPARHETAIGTVSHYYGHLNVAVVQINTGELRTGDTISIKGHTTDLTQTVDSMEYEHRHIDKAEAGQIVGIKVRDHVRVHDVVFVIR